MVASWLEVKNIIQQSYYWNTYEINGLISSRLDHFREAEGDCEESVPLFCLAIGDRRETEETDINSGCDITANHMLMVSAVARRGGTMGRGPAVVEWW